VALVKGASSDTGEATAQAPGVIRPVGAQGEKYTYVIMPMYNTR
jgi:hypothetical protein